ncbi:hypothetical protein HY024_01010 [Candidatus Curtissbacteria bacterium]|nr:hypothetical protein [Candidatus Curtissbacteria bacterium]
MALDRRAAEIPSKGRLQEIVVDRGANKHPFLTFVFESGEPRSIPILSVRDPNQHGDIARAIASHKPVIFMAGGVIGAGNAVRHGTDGARVFWDTFKPGRPETSKLPMMVAQEKQYEIIDWSKVHEDFKFLKSGPKRADFFGQLPMHVIYPHNSYDRVTDRAFITEPSDMAQEHEIIRANVPTVCMYFQRDSDWVKIAHIIGEYAPWSRFGITSCNEKGKKPPFSLAEFEADVMRRVGEGKTVWEATQAVAYIEDPIAEEIGVASSQSQVRIPLKGERPTLKLVRHGPVSPRLIKAQTGADVEVPSDENGNWTVKFSERRVGNDIDLDMLVQLQTQKINAHIAGRSKNHRIDFAGRVAI